LVVTSVTGAPVTVYQDRTSCVTGILCNITSATL
jgi:hypothetical protein